MAVANSAALAAANITAATPDPAGAKIDRPDRDPSGPPTGILREAAAYALVAAKIPPPTLEQRRQALTVAIADIVANGVTTVQDNSEWDDFLALEELEHTNKLPIRIGEWMDFNQPVEVLKQRRASHPSDDLRLHLTQLKGYMDGSLGSRTAAMEEPYSDDPGNSGLARYDQDKLNHMAAERAAAGFQLGFHAIGDRANNMALNAFGVADQVASLPPSPPEHDPDANIVTRPESGTPPPAALRFRVEHAQVLLPGDGARSSDFERFEKEGVIASMQPSHLLTDMKWATDRLGPERIKNAYAWKSFLDHKVTLAFGTDYPVELINPFRGLYAAITRQNEAGTQTFQPQEKISLNEAIYAYTQASAYGEFREKVKGRLEPGYLADLIVLDRDITTATPQQLLHTKILRTVVNGETVYTTSATKPATAKAKN
jgi:predicted amidohydrolase YtcJ